MVVLLALQADVAGTTIEVPGDRPNLSSALNAADPGDSILLGVGTHVLPGGRRITVPIAGSGPGTTLVANGGALVVDVGAGEEAVLQGLTLDGQGFRAVACSGGTVVLRDVVLSDGETLGDGGLVSAEDCTLVLDRVTLRDTTVSGAGGLLYAEDSEVRITQSTFRGGQAGSGGALHLDGGTLELADSLFLGNSATGGGGALYGIDLSLRGSGNRWQANQAADGGAIRLVGGSARLVGDRVLGNLADAGTGGLSFQLGDIELGALELAENQGTGAGGLLCAETSRCAVEDSLFRANSGSLGGGASVDGGVALSHDSFCGNVAVGAAGQGGGLHSVGGTGAYNLFLTNRAGAAGGGLFLEGGVHEHLAFVADQAPSGAALAAGGATFELRDSLFVGAMDGPSVWTDQAPADFSVLGAWFHDNPAGTVAFTTDPSIVLAGADPQVVDLAGRSCDREALRPLAGSPLLDAGVGTDPDGSAADIGLFSGAADLDADGDGVRAAVDCDDTDAAVGRASLRFEDADGDGFGYASLGLLCPAPGNAAAAGDCDDTDPSVHPGAAELANGLDDDCDVRIDETTRPWYPDTDGDGFGDAASVVYAAAAPVGHVADASDCDDADGAVNPAATEICGGGDEDCDGLLDDEDVDVGQTSTWYVDADGDGLAGDLVTRDACVQPAGTDTAPTDCDDTDPGITLAVPWYADADGDSFGDPGVSTEACVQPAGSVADAGDCDDADPLVHPGAVEICGGVDEDCDGLVDDADPDLTGQSTFYVDADGDGSFGTPVEACVLPPDGSELADDCDDTDPTRSPTLPERCAAGDEDCDGLEGDADPDVVDQQTVYVDDDGDGWNGTVWVTCEPPASSGPTAEDCDDSDAAIHPGATEICDPDDVDENCDGVADDADPSVVGQQEVHVDQDGDGHGALVAVLTCEDGLLSGDDCDDAAPATFPGAWDVPDDGIDQDCDGTDAVWTYASGCSSSPTSASWALLAVALFSARRRRAGRPTPG